MKKFGFWIGKVLAALLGCSGAALIVCVAKFQMLPMAALVIAAEVLLGLVGLVLYITWQGKGKVKMTVGIILAVIFTLLFSLIAGYGWTALKTFENISNAPTETVHVGIYVRSDDTNDYDSVAAEYTYGILQTIDRESTDKAMQELNANLGKQVDYREYQNLPALIDALLNKEVDAIILNEAFLHMLEEMIGYEEKMSQLREAVYHKVEIERPVEESTETPVDSGTGESVEKLPIDEKAFVLYISGIDATGKASYRSRSDVNILAVVNPTTRQILLVSTPRDYYVPLSISDGVRDKLTHAGNYGVKVSKDTMAMLYDINIDYYFKVNFSGFKTIIDALGGVTVNSEVSFSRYGYTFVKGLNEMNGDMALVFCRERYSLAGGDRQRGRNQMSMIKAVIDKLISPALLTNYTEVLKSIEDNFETNVPMSVVGDLVSSQLKNGGSWNIQTYSVDGTGDYQIPYSMGQEAYVMWPNQTTVECAKALIQSVLTGQEEQTQIN